MLPLAQPHVLDLVAYVPGKTIRDTQREYGIDNLIKLASNENAWGPSKKAIEAAKIALLDGHLYPLEMRNDVKKRICDYHAGAALNTKNIVLGNGSNELIVLLARALLGEQEILLNGWPSFLMYRISAQAQGRQEHTVPLTSEFQYDLDTMADVANGKRRDQIKLVFIANPNNPTGQYIGEQRMNDFIGNLPEHVVVVIDEAYTEYVTQKDYASAIPWVLKRPRTVVLKTFSKIFGLAGFRIGYAICDEEVASVLHRIRDPFNVNSIAQAAAVAALGDHEHIRVSQQSNQQELPKMRAVLSELGIPTTDSAGNFVLMHLQEGMPSTGAVVEGLIHQGVIVRPLLNYDLPRALRITVGRPEENEQFFKALSVVLKP